MSGEVVIDIDSENNAAATSAVPAAPATLTTPAVPTATAALTTLAAPANHGIQMTTLSNVIVLTRQDVAEEIVEMRKEENDRFQKNIGKGPSMKLYYPAAMINGFLGSLGMMVTGFGVPYVRYVDHSLADKIIMIGGVSAGFSVVSVAVFGAYKVLDSLYSKKVRQARDIWAARVLAREGEILQQKNHEINLPKISLPEDVVAKLLSENTDSSSIYRLSKRLFTGLDGMLYKSAREKISEGHFIKIINYIFTGESGEDLSRGERALSDEIREGISQDLLGKENRYRDSGLYQFLFLAHLQRNSMLEKLVDKDAFVLLREEFNKRFIEYSKAKYGQEETERCLNNVLFPMVESFISTGKIADSKGEKVTKISGAGVGAESEVDSEREAVTKIFGAGAGVVVGVGVGAGAEFEDGAESEAGVGASCDSDDDSGVEEMKGGSTDPGAEIAISEIALVLLGDGEKHR